MWQHSPVPCISTTFSVFLNIFCHRLLHSFSSWSYTLLQPRRIQLCEPNQGWAPTAPHRSLSCVSATLLRQPSRHCTPFWLSSVLMPSTMERQMMAYYPFIPLCQYSSLKYFSFCPRVIMVTKLISYTERALSGGWRRQEAAAHFSHDGLGVRWRASAILQPHGLAETARKSWACAAGISSAKPLVSFSMPGHSTNPHSGNPPRLAPHTCSSPVVGALL